MRAAAIILLVTVSTLLGKSEMLNAQPIEPDGWRWLPASGLMPPLLADPLAPRTAVLKSLGEPFVEASLGSSWDIVQWRGRRPFLGIQRIGFGVAGGAVMRFRIEHRRSIRLATAPFGFRQIDGFEMEEGDFSFAGYIVGERLLSGLTTRYRLNLGHTSAHLADGRFDPVAGAWTGGPPVDFSRDYVQLLTDVESPLGWRAYLEGSRLFLHDGWHRNVGSWYVRGGGEYRWRAWLLRPFAAADARTFHVDDPAVGRLGYRLTGGVRLGSWDRQGVNVVVVHYRGPNWRGQHFGESTSEWQLGLYTEFR